MLTPICVGNLEVINAQNDDLQHHCIVDNGAEENGMLYMFFFWWNSNNFNFSLKVLKCSPFCAVHSAV